MYVRMNIVRYVARYICWKAGIVTARIEWPPEDTDFISMFWVSGHSSENKYIIYQTIPQRCHFTV